MKSSKKYPDDIKQITGKVQDFLSHIEKTNTSSDRFIKIVAETSRAAGKIIVLIKQLPKTGKFGRSIFIKTYNRRPMNKHKRSIIMAQVASSSAMSAVRIATINSQPTKASSLKYGSGCSDQSTALMAECRPIKKSYFLKNEII